MNFSTILTDPETEQRYEVHVDTSQSHQIWLTVYDAPERHTFPDTDTLKKRAVIGLDIYDGKAQVVVTTDEQLNEIGSDDPDQTVFLFRDYFECHECHALTRNDLESEVCAFCCMLCSPK